MIDSDKIIQSAKQEVLDKKITSDITSFETIPVPEQLTYLGMEISDFSPEDLKESILYMDSHYEVTIWHPTGSARRLIGPLIGFFQRVMRKLTRFFVQPIVEDQNTLNWNIVKAIRQIRNYIAVDKEILDDKVELVRTLSRQTEELEKRVAEIEKENNTIWRDGK